MGGKRKPLLRRRQQKIINADKVVENQDSSKSESYKVPLGTHKTGDEVRRPGAFGRAFRVRKQLSKVKLSSYGHLSHKVVGVLVDMMSDRRALRRRGQSISEVIKNEDTVLVIVLNLADAALSQ